MTEPRIHVLHVGGVREPQDSHGVSGTFLAALDGDRFAAILPASAAIDYGFPQPFAKSAAIARRAVIEHIHKAPNHVVLSGYSGGSFIVGDLAADIAAGRVPGIDVDKIAAVALLADPKRPPGGGCPGIATPGGYGIAGIREIPGIYPTFWGTASRDAIAALGAENPLRFVADLSKAFTTNPQGWDEWAQSMFQTLNRWELQPWWMFWNRPGRWGAAIEALAGYLGGRHTNDYLDEGVSVKLAAAVNEAVR